MLGLDTGCRGTGTLPSSPVGSDGSGEEPQTGVTQREPPERALVRGQRPCRVRRFQYMAFRTEPAKAIYAFVQEEILQMWNFYFLIFIYYF